MPRVATAALLFALAGLAVHGCSGGSGPGGGTAASTPAVVVQIDPLSRTAGSPPDLYGWSGNIWYVPLAFETGAGVRILSLGHPGLTRVSLGDQVLQHATSLDDLRRRLAANPINEFLRIQAAKGGTIMFILDGTPRYLASDPSTAKGDRGGSWPAFRMSPPADYAAWSDAVEAIVRHYNGTMGLDACYEAWNEPSWYYDGTSGDFFRQYRHSVLGARRADPRARIGGPGLSEITQLGTHGDLAVTDAATFVTDKLSQRYMLQRFLGYAAGTPLPELGLARLPVDFVSWHSYYANPTTYHAAVAPFIRDAVAAAGYPASTPVITSEWNIAAVPPYPEGDLNGSHVDAAFLASSLISMRRAGVDRQAFQMYVDPGPDPLLADYHGGLFTSAGEARANFSAVQMFAKLGGTELAASSSDPWVSCAAFADGTRTWVLLSCLVPTPMMVSNSQTVEDPLANGDFTRSIVAAGLVPAVVRGEPLPEPFRSQQGRIDDAAAAARRAARAKAAAWRGGITVTLRRADLPAPPGPVRRYLIDAGHSTGGDLEHDDLVWPAGRDLTLAMPADAVQLLAIDAAGPAAAPPAAIGTLVPAGHPPR